MVDEIVWEDPPPTQTSRTDRVMAQLRKHPGRWALIGEERTVFGGYWWGKFRQDPDFEVKVVFRDPAAPLGAHAIYCRLIDRRVPNPGVEGP